MNDDVLFDAILLLLRCGNRFHATVAAGKRLSVESMIIEDLLIVVRELKQVLSKEEREAVISYMHSEKPIFLIKNKLTDSKKLNALLKELLKEGSYYKSRIPGYLIVTLEGLAASSNLVSSVSAWFLPTPPTRDSSPPRTARVTHQSAPGAGIHIVPPKRVRRAGGIPIGGRRPQITVDFRVHGESFFARLDRLVRSSFSR